MEPYTRTRLVSAPIRQRASPSGDYLFGSEDVFSSLESLSVAGGGAGDRRQPTPYSFVHKKIQSRGSKDSRESSSLVYTDAEHYNIVPYSSYFKETSGYIGSFPPLISPNRTKLEARLRRRVLSLNSNGGLDNGLFLSEFPEIHAGFKGLPGLVNTAFSAANGLLPLIKAGATLDLAYKFGFAPIVSSIRNAAVSSTMNMLNQRKTFRVNETSRELVQVNHGGGDHAISVSERLQLVAYINLPSSLWQQLDSLGSFTPPALAWNVIPMSFLVDQIVDVAGYLRDMQSYMASGMTVSGCLTYSSLQSCEVSDSITDVDTSPTGFGVHYSHRSMACSSLYTTMDRSRVNTEWFRPQLPPINVNLGGNLLGTIGEIILSGL